MVFTAPIILGGCVPAVIELPEYLHGTVLVEDVRHEVRLARRFFRIRAGNEILYGAGAPVIVFPAPLQEMTPSTETTPLEETTPLQETDDRRIEFVPERDRAIALDEAWDWLSGQGTHLIIAVPAADRNRRTEAESLLAGEEGPPGEEGIAEEGRAEEGRAGGEGSPGNEEPRGEEATLVLLEQPGDPRRSARRILDVAGSVDVVVLLLCGSHGPAIAEALFAEENIGGAPPPPVVLELFLRRGGERLRATGVPIKGAVVLDLARTLREFSASGVEEPLFYVPSVFYRY